MTKEEIKDYIKPRLLRKYARQYKNDRVWAWNLIKTAVGHATAGEKIEIISAVENVSIIRKAIDAEADSEAETMLEDDTLDLAELKKILGGD